MDDHRNSSLNLDMVKLFVGQIPKEMDEDSLRVYFEEFGPLAELSIIRDSVNLGSKGCAFVTYRHAESAQLAVEKLHDKVKLPNSLNALQVRVAETQTERENKLFIGMLPKTVNEQDLHSMFIPYGELREVHIIRGPEGSPKGCAFVKYVEREAAIAAIEDLNDSIPMGATRPLVVKFADSKKQGGKKNDFGFDDHMGGGFQSRGGHMGGPTDFWQQQQPQSQQQKAMYPYSMQQPPHLSQNQQQQQQPMMPSYSPYGNQQQLQQQQRFMYMSTPPSAPINSNYYPSSLGGSVGGQSPYLGGMPGPLGGGPVDYGLDNNGSDKKFGKSPVNVFSQGDRDQQQQQAVKPSGGGYSIVAPQGQQFDQQDGLSDSQGLPISGDHEPHSRPPEGPSGANLFIYHLPRDLTDADLATLFAPFGNVISAKVFVDKKTSDSKGFGFVSYDVLDSANSAIESMNGFQIGSKRLKVQHKRVMSGGGGDDDFSYGGGGMDPRMGGGGGGYSQQPPRRGGGGGMNSLLGGMAGMNLTGYPSRDTMGGMGSPDGLYGGPLQMARAPPTQYGYDFPKQQPQAMSMPGHYRDNSGGMPQHLDYSMQQQQQQPQQRYQQY